MMVSDSEQMTDLIFLPKFNLILEWLLSHFEDFKLAYKNNEKFIDHPILIKNLYGHITSSLQIQERTDNFRLHN